MFNFKAIKVAYIIAIYIQSYLDLYLSRFITYAASFILRKLFLEQTQKLVQG